MDGQTTEREHEGHHARENLALATVVVRGILIGLWVGLLSGLASAGFLWALDYATDVRKAHPWLLFGLPLAGVFIGLVYTRHGKTVAGGANLLLERVHDPNGEIPFRMAPMILFTTVLTHLFGGSAGREGTAVQMGGTLADLAVKPLRLSKADRRILIMTGISAGFGSVFGTPLAGAIFGLEVIGIGRIKYDALVPCLVASVMGDLVCRGVGIHHHAYDAVKTFALTPQTFGWTILASFLFAAAAVAFSELAHAIQNVGKGIKGAPYVRPVIGGLAVIAMTLVVGSQAYNGLSLDLIQQAFHRGEVPLYAFALKIVFTAVTLGSGFKGGEVTPLFCVGATLGSAFAQVTGQDPALFAALGFVAVFAGAANTPLACAIMGIELFGSQLTVPLAIACVLTYILSGHRGIYLSQQVHHPKTPHAMIEEGQTLRALHRDGYRVEHPYPRGIFRRADDEKA